MPISVGIGGRPVASSQVQPACSPLAPASTVCSATPRAQRARPELPLARQEACRTTKGEKGQGRRPADDEGGPFETRTIGFTSSRHVQSGIHMPALTL